MALWLIVLPLIKRAFGHAPEYPRECFTTAAATDESYAGFIESLRGRLRSGQVYNGTHGAMPLLRDPSSVSDSERFVLVQLSNWAGATITVAVDVINVYVVGYQAGGDSYFFNDTADLARSNLFTNTRQHQLPFASTYNSLENCARQSREDIDLGIPVLEQAISTLSGTSTFSDQSPVCRSLIIVIQMVAEAARYTYIEQRVRRSINYRADNSTRNAQENVVFRPDPLVMSLETNWQSLSEAVQGSDGEGNFPRPVRLRTCEGTLSDATRVTDTLTRILALMLFSRRNQPSQSSSQHVHDEL